MNKEVVGQFGSLGSPIQKLNVIQSQKMISM